jgi:SAM-dependent methyltransferase
MSGRTTRALPRTPRYRLGVDQPTLDAYDRLAKTYARTWNEQEAPTDLYRILDRYFRPGLTADIGCGAGRDTAWLVHHGYDTIGFDASEALLNEARQRHPAIEFRRAVLPELEEIDDEQFTNVLCETVIMHLDPADVGTAVRRLVAILAPGGTLCLTWRAAEGAASRDRDGRLYSRVDPATVTAELTAAALLHDTEEQSLSSGRTVHRLIARLPEG